VFVADFIGRANFLDVEVERLGTTDADIRVLGHRWTVPKHPDVQPGDLVTLLVRPESVRLNASAADTVAGPVGRVLSSMFYGESIEYEIESEAGNLVVSVADPHADQTFATGSLVDVGFEAARSWLMPVAPAAPA
jgi:iron(III) transport system ATP-binding protein